MDVLDVLCKYHKRENIVNKLVSLYNSGQISKTDIIKYRHIIDSLVFKDIQNKINKSHTRDLTIYECVRLSQRFHYMMIIKLKREKNCDVSKIPLKDRIHLNKKFEKLCVDLKNGNVEDNKIDFLISLPKIENWEEDKIYDMSMNSPFSL